MDLWSVGFVALMVVLSGGIAYCGDVIGRSIGKKRLKIGRLRPKHTAALLTALFGSFATLLVIGILFGLSENVRIWIIEGNKARQDLAQVRSELEGAQQSLEKQTQSLAESQQKLKQEEGRIKTARADNERLKKEATELNRRVGGLQKETAAFRQRLAAASRSLAAVNRDLNGAKRESAQLKLNNQEFVRQNKEIQSQNLRLTNNNAELESRIKALDGELKRLTADKTQLEATKTQLEKFRDELLEEAGRRSVDLRNLNTQLGDVQRELELSNQQLEQIRRSLDGAQQMLANVQVAARTRPLILSRQDELVRFNVPARLNLAEGRSLLIASMERASEEARRRGASSRGGRDYVAFIDVETQRGTLRAEEIFQQSATALTNGSVPRLLILRALFNTFQGEFVPLDVEVVANPVVYQRAEVVLEARIDGKLTEDQIAGAIEEFVRGPLRQEVLKDGLIPAIGSPQPLGELSRDSVLRLVQQIRSRGAFVRVQFLAAAETRAGDVLKLDFRLR